MSRKPSKPTSREISAEKLAELKKNAAGVLAEARRQLINQYPFIGSIAMNLEVIPVRDKRVPTACTDGSTIYFDIDFLSSLTPPQQLFVFGHEVWHVVMMHFARKEHRETQLFNVATDLEVNQILVKDGLDIPKECLMPNNGSLMQMGIGISSVPADLSAEEYYEIILAAMKKQQKQQNQQQNQSGNGPSGGNNGGGNSDGKLGGQFDRHEYNDEGDGDGDDREGQTNSNSDVDDKYGKVGYDADFQPKIQAGAVEKVREMTISAAQQVERQRGEMPAHIKRLVDKLLDPEIPWQEVLAKFVTRAVGEKTSWSRPNRRFAWSGTYLPSHYGEKIKVAVGIDTSGSTAGDMQKFLGEVNGIVKSFGAYELHVIECDAEIGAVKYFDDENPLDLENEEYDVTGGGGTYLTPIFNHIKENDLDVDCIVCFTDGYIEKMDESVDPGIPTLWILTADGNKDAISFGEIHKFNNRD